MKDHFVGCMCKDQKSVSGVFLSPLASSSLPSPSLPALLSSRALVGSAPQTSRCPFQLCVMPAPCCPEEQDVRDSETPEKGLGFFDFPLPCLFSCFRAVPWVCVISGQTVFLTHGDQHECVSVSIYSAEVTRHGCFMSLFCHVSLQAGQRASGWMGSANLPIYYSCQLWKGIFFLTL